MSISWNISKVQSSKLKALSLEGFWLYCEWNPQKYWTMYFLRKYVGALNISATNCWLILVQDARDGAAGIFGVTPF